MKKNELKYLMNLHERIGKGCEILKVSRDGFMSALTQCFDLVSLGMEMGVRMKGAKGKSEKPGAKATPKAKPSASREKRQAEIAVLREKALKRLSKGPVPFNVLVKDLTKYVGSVTRPEQAIWSFLRSCPEIQQLKPRGPYSLRSKRGKGASSKKGAKKKGASNGKTTAVAPALVN